MKYLTALLLLTSCSSSSYIDPGFSRYITQYTNIFKKAGCDVNLSKLTVTFESLVPVDQLGTCTKYISGRMHIRIDSGYWFNNLDESDKLQLIAHELEHCLYNIPHNNIPSDYMYPTLYPKTTETMIDQMTSHAEAICK